MKRLPLLLCLPLAACSSQHAAQVRAYEGNERGEYYARSLAAAAVHPAVDAALPDAIWRESGESLRKKADAWKVRDQEGRALAGFRTLDDPDARARASALSDDARSEAALRAGLDVADLAVIALRRNPAIRAARQSWRARIEMYEQAGYLENLVLQYRAFTKTLETAIGEPMQKSEVAEAFPFPATVALKGELVDREAEIAWQEYRKEIRTVLVALGTTHHELEYVERSIVVTQESRDLLAHMADVARARYEAGAGGQVDVLRIQSELSRLNNDLTTLAQSQATGQARLNALLARSPQAPLGPVRAFAAEDSNPKLEMMLAAALSSRQEVAVARLEIELEERAIRLAETMVYPRASRGSSLAQTGMTREAGPDRGEAIFPQTPMVEPRFSFGSDAAYLNQLRRELEAARSRLEALENQVRFEVKELHFNLDTARRQVKLFQGALVPQAEQALAATRSGYETGKVLFLDFIDAQRTYLNARLGLEKARQDWRQAVTRMLEVIGSDEAE